MGRKINILLLVDCIKDLEGGAERQIFELAKGLNKEKFVVTIVSLECEGEAPRELIESVGCRLMTYPVKRIYGLSGILKGFSFVGFLKRQEIDILMTYHFGSDIWGTVCGKLAGVRTIISNRRDMGFWRSKRHVLAYKLLNRWVSKIIVNAQAIKKMVMDTESVPEEEIEVIYNGIDLKRATRVTQCSRLKENFGIQSDDIVIMHVANLRPVKGHKHLLEAMAGVVEQHQNVKLVLIGEGELKSALEDQAAQLNIKDHVLFLGKRPDARDLLEAADVCVLPSLSEGMSNAIMEYMAAGKPVIATNVGGSPELVKNGFNGILVGKGSVDELKKALTNLIESREKRMTFGRNAFQKVSDEFSMGQMVGKYEGMLQSFVSEKRKVLHLISSGGLFGAESIVLTLGQSIEDSKYLSVIGALNDGRGAGQMEVIEEAERLGVETYLLKCYGRFDITTIFRLKKALIKNRVDILHTHNYKSDIIGALAAKLAGVPVVATAHGFTDVTRAVTFYERLDRWFLRHFFKKVVTVTDKLLSDLSAEKRTVIPNGIDMEKFKRDDEQGKFLRHEYNVGETDILIGTVGRLSKEKNQKMILEAVYPLMREDERIKVMIVGAGPKEGEMKQFVQARHLTDRIIFTGIMKDTVAAYSAMDIFVLSSLTEGVPLTVLEAMACRVPVIATRVGGIPDMLKDGETGLLVEARDTDALRKAIEVLLGSVGERQKLTASSYAFIQTNYSLEQMRAAYRQVYNETLSCIS